MESGEFHAEAGAAGGEAVEVAVDELLTAIREAVKRGADATTQDKKEYGLGQRLDLENTKSLAAASQTVLEVAHAKPDRAQTLSILPEGIPSSTRCIGQRRRLIPRKTRNERRLR